MVREIAGRVAAANRGFAIAERNMLWVESGRWKENGKGRLEPLGVLERPIALSYESTTHYPLSIPPLQLVVIPSRGSPLRTPASSSLAVGCDWIGQSALWTSRE